MFGLPLRRLKNQELRVLECFRHILLRILFFSLTLYECFRIEGFRMFLHTSNRNTALSPLTQKVLQDHYFVLSVGVISVLISRVEVHLFLQIIEGVDSPP